MIAEIMKISSVQQIVDMLTPEQKEEWKVLIATCLEEEQRVSEDLFKIRKMYLLWLEKFELFKGLCLFLIEKTNLIKKTRKQSEVDIDEHERDEGAPEGERVPNFLKRHLQ